MLTQIFKRVQLGWFLAISVLAAGAVAQDKDAGKKTDDIKEKIQQGQELIGTGDYAKAAQILKECVDADDQAGDAWFLLGYALHMDKQLDKALEAHKRAAEFDGPLKPVATYNIACARRCLANRKRHWRR